MIKELPGLLPGAEKVFKIGRQTWKGIRLFESLSPMK